MGVWRAAVDIGGTFTDLVEPWVISSLADRLRHPASGAQVGGTVPQARSLSMESP